MIALSWGAMVATLMFAVVHSVLFPTFSRIQAERARVRSAYLVSLQYISVVGILVNSTLYVVAPDFLYHVLGRGTEKWLPALTALRILCVYGVIRVVLEPLGNVLMALGRTTLMLRATMVAAVLELVLLYPALRWFGIEGAAVVVTLAYAAQYAIYRPFLRAELGVGASDVFRTVGPALASLLLIVPIFLYYEYYAFHSTLLLLVQKVAACLIGYVLAYCLITRRRILADVRALLDVPRAR
jgi:O-antigen/teichoic acid export membrane protein